MRGAIPFITEIIAALAIAALLVGYLILTSPEAKASIPTYRAPRIQIQFDFSDYILGKNAIDLNDYFSSDDFCTNLKSCIKQTLLTNEPCDIAIIPYGTNSKIDYPISIDASRCSREPIVQSLTPTVNQTLCTFWAFSSTTPEIVSDTNGLSFTECEFLENGNGKFPNAETDLNENEFVPPPTSSPIVSHPTLFFSPDRMYTINISSFPNSISPTLISNFWNGPGRVRLRLSKATVSTNGFCAFTLRYCNQAAIAENDRDVPIEVYKQISSLEMWHIFTIPYYIRDLSSTASEILKNVDLYYYNEFKINLDKPYPDKIYKIQKKNSKFEFWLAVEGERNNV